MLGFRAGPVPELKHLCVYPGSRGAGVGGALCRWLEEQAWLAGHGEIILGVESGCEPTPAAPSRVLFYARAESP